MYMHILAVGAETILDYGKLLGLAFLTAVQSFICKRKMKPARGCCELL